MERAPLRKPREYFDSAPHPSHVTFDDGKATRRNLPWSQYIEARWDYGEPDVVRVEIGDWIATVRGHNLGPLYIAIEEHRLLRVRAQPELGEVAKFREHEPDTFATEITFAPVAKNPVPAKSGQLGFSLD